jgi:glycosyltransferase involved in cell wall biosynthesis
MIEASVMIFAYNRDQFLPEAINSVITQLDSDINVEIIVSTCFTVSPKFKKEIQYKQIKFVEFPEGIKYGEQFVKTFDISNGEIIFILEDDDLFLPWKIERSLAILKSSDDVMFIKDTMESFTNGGDHSIISERLKKSPSDFDLIKIENNYYTYKKFSRTGVWANPSSMVLRRRIIEENKEVIQCNDPIDILLAISIFKYDGYCAIYNSALTLYRVHTLQDSVSFSSIVDRESFNRWKKTLYKYSCGYKCLSKLINNFPFSSKVIYMNYKIVDTLFQEAAYQTKAMNFIFKLIFISLSHLKDCLLETNQAKFTRLEVLRWYFHFWFELTKYVSFSILYFIRSRSFKDDF